MNEQEEMRDLEAKIRSKCFESPEMENQKVYRSQAAGGQEIDPWKDRQYHMKCKTCIFYVPKEPSPTGGRCRRHAPTMNGYPVVFVTDWCGDHKLNENA